MSSPKSTPERRARKPGRPPDAHGVQGRELLLRAARELMTEKGAPQVTVREVTDRAGVGAALVSYYFGSKSGLFRAIVEQVAGEAALRLERALATEGSVQDRLREFVLEVIGAMRAEPYLPRLMVEYVLFGEKKDVESFARDFAGPNVELLRSLLEEGMRSGEIREVKPMLVVPAVMGACVHFFLSGPLLLQVFDLDSLTPELTEAYATSTAELITRGLGGTGHE